MQTIIAAAAPHILEIVSLVLAALLAWVANTARRKFGIDIEARHREALHQALMTGARLAMDRHLTGTHARELVTAYVRRSVPDALSALRPGDDLLNNLADAKLQDALTVAMSQAATR